MRTRLVDPAIDIDVQRARQQVDDAPPQSTQDAVDDLSLAFFGFWPGIVWLPLPFDTRIASRKRN